MQDLKAAGIRVKYDDSDNARPGWKFAEYEMKGVPVRVAMGARDLQNNVAEVARRDTKEKTRVTGWTSRTHQKIVGRNSAEHLQQGIGFPRRKYNQS